MIATRSILRVKSIIYILVQFALPVGAFCSPRKLGQSVIVLQIDVGIACKLVKVPQI